MVQATAQGVGLVNGISMTGKEPDGNFTFPKTSVMYMIETMKELADGWTSQTSGIVYTTYRRTSKMSDPNLLYDYVEFVDEVTSKASKDPEEFSDALDIIEEQGVAPERLLTGTWYLCRRW